MFDYGKAFACNEGLVTLSEQERLRHVRVCIAGMGAVGGEYLMALARCGVGKFHIADFDQFEMKNFNRQYGATMSNLGQRKAEVMARMARDINPELEITVFERGVTAENVGDFLGGCDVAVDGIDIFQPDEHRLLIRACQERGIPVLAALPAGFGAGMLSFDSRGMSFDDYFDFRPGMSAEEKVLDLVMGFAPAGFHLKYLDLGSVDFQARRGPSSIAAVKLCAGLVTAQVLTALFRPLELRSAPWYTHVDARLLRIRHARLWRGNRNPVQRLKKRIAVELMKRRSAAKKETLSCTPAPRAATP